MGTVEFNPWPYVIFGMVSFLVLAPLLALILGSFSLARLPMDFSLSNMGLKNYSKVYLDPFLYELIGNTVIYVGGSVVIGISLAATLAWLTERTDMPGKILVYAGVPMTLAVPGMLQAMAWVLLLSPRIGMMNRWWMDFFGSTQPPINIYSLGGMIFVEGLRLVPTAFLMLVPLLRSMDPSLEEAAATSGIKPTAIIRKITLRLLAPAVFAVMVYQAMTALEIFEVPGILGLPSRIYVFSTKIYAIIRSATLIPVYGQANALAMTYLLVAVVATYFYSRMISRTERFTVITGKGYRPHPIELGSWKIPALSIVSVYLFLAVVVPFIVFLYVSFLPFLQIPSVSALSSLTLKNYRLLVTYSEVGSALKNTIIMVAVTATVTTFLSFFISMVVIRSRFRGRRLLDQLAFLPHAIPGIVTGLAFVWVFIKLDFVLPVYGTIWAMVIGFTTSFIAYGTRAMNAALLQIHKELEEAAHVSGLVAWRTTRRILFPLMLPTFAGVWIWVVLHAVRVAGMPLMLYEGSKNQVLAVLIWNMWDEGYIPAVAAIGTLLMISLLFLTLLIRATVFRSHRIEIGMR